MTENTHITHATVSEFITNCVMQSEKTQRQIAEECGFENANVITMLKTGATKIPLNRIGTIAKSLSVDPAHLLRLVMTEYMPDTWASVEEIMKGSMLTANELEVIRLFRSATANNDPKPVSLTSTIDVAINVATH